MTTIDFSDQ